VSTEHPHPFDDLVRNSGETFRLAHAALLWARDEYDSIAPVQYLERLNALADRVDQQGARDGYERVEAIRSVLVEAESFCGNVEDFVNPANSYINRVIDTRRGIPVSLSVIWMDIAGQLDWPFSGVSMPGHFLVCYEGMGETLYVDPFNNGQELHRDQCEQMVKTLYGQDFDFKDEHLEPVSTRTILGRMLGNLYVTYARSSDWLRSARVLERISALKGEDTLVHAELGRLYLLIGNLRSAAVALNRAEELAQTDDEVATVRHHLSHLRMALGQQN
jgi:regulator of sirC expression with transglutaminase-like and TPR domain